MLVANEFCPMGKTMNKFAVLLTMFCVVWPSLFTDAMAATPYWKDSSECRKLIDGHNYKEAVDVCSKAAESGEASAMFNLSSMYSFGWGVDKDETLKFNWLRAAADLRYPPAEYVMASHYAAGSGVPRNAKESLRLLHDAANQGLLLAQMMLATYFERGHAKLGIDKNIGQAISWYSKAAEQCDSCQYQLWRIYYFGKGVDKNVPLATAYLIKAAEGGLPSAQMQLGFCYHDGDGVAQDDIRAYKWMYLGAKGGEPFAKKALAPLARKMSFRQVSEAKKMANHFMEHQKIDTRQLCSIYNKYCEGVTP